ncbi:MAG: PKD domain-containing protein [Planctomycetota bacterium]
MQHMIRRRSSVSVSWTLTFGFLTILLQPFSVISAQFTQVLPVTTGGSSISNVSIFVDDSCLGCAPQQVSICAQTENEVLFTGSVLDFQTMFPVLVSSGEVFSPALAQGLVASYFISLEQQFASGPRSVFLIESFAAGFGDPILISTGAVEAFDSSITILLAGQQVISWSQSTGSATEIWAKYDDTAPILCGVGEKSRVLPLSSDSVLVLWQDGTVLKSLTMDSGSVSTPVDLYDLLTPFSRWDAAVQSTGSIQLVVASFDQLQLLTGSMTTGITSQEVIRSGGGEITDLAFSSLSPDRYTVSWIASQQANRYTVIDGDSSNGPLEGIPGEYTGLDMELDAHGNEHYVLLVDGIAIYAHDTPAPVANPIILTEDDGIADHTIFFEDQSTGLIESYQWDFGDGGTSTQIEGSYTYLEPGTYTVSLTVTGPGGEDTRTHADSIVVATPTNAMELADINVFGGQPVIHPVLGTHEDFLQGFQIAVAYDSNVINMTELSIAGTLAESLDPEFIASSINPDGEDSFLYLAIIFDTLPPFDGRMMVPGSNQTLCTLNYTVLQNASLGTSTELRFADGLGTPPINTIYATEGGQSLTPYWIHATVTVSEQAQFLFIRGDSTYDQAVNIADAIFLLDYLFISGPASVCPDAADANDDGVINIGDAINLLNFLFSGGETIPYPYPGYGLDPTPDSLNPCLP